MGAQHPHLDLVTAQAPRSRPERPATPGFGDGGGETLPVRWDLALPRAASILHTGAAAATARPGGGQQLQADGKYVVNRVDHSLSQEISQDHNDLFVLDLAPSLKTLTILAIIENNLSTEVTVLQFEDLDYYKICFAGSPSDFINGNTKYDCQ